MSPRVGWLLLGLLAMAGTLSAQEGPPRVADERLLLRTTMGDLVIELYPDVAPEHVAQILKLVRMGLYDGLAIYQADPMFLVQVSNVQHRQTPMTPEQQAAIHRLRGEFSASLKHRRGIVTMARDASDPDSAETSFSIMVVDAPHLDGRYTIFGRLARGDDVLDAIANVDCDALHRPLEPVVIERTEVVGSLGALSRLRLRTAIPRPSKRPQRLAASLFPWVSGLLVFFGLGTFLLAGRLPQAMVGAHGLLAVLIGFFCLYVVYAPQAIARPWLGVLAFVVPLGVFKLMSLFERR